jgi:death on curing protein
MDEPEWVILSVVRALHEEQLAEHGGSPGTRDEGLLESALAKPKNLFHYEDAELAALAASYAIGIAKNHPFIDSNKRTSFVVATTFLYINGFAVETTDAEVVTTWLQVAEGTIDENALAKWFGQRLTPL